jgi:predicted nucleotidyltransferase
MGAERQAGYAKVRPGAVRRLLKSPWVAVASHWTFQSLFYMDPTERWFKIGLDLLLTVAGALLLGIWLPGVVPWAMAFALAHTLNFLFNGQLWGVLKHFGLVSFSADQFGQYTQGLRQRARSEPSIRRFLVYGSLVRGEWSSSSDLDARVLRHPGLVNGLRSCWFLMRERTRALFARFPLDIYVADSERSLGKLCPEESAVDLLDEWR